MAFSSQMIYSLNKAFILTKFLLRVNYVVHERCSSAPKFPHWQVMSICDNEMLSSMLLAVVQSEPLP